MVTSSNSCDTSVINLSVTTIPQDKTLGLLKPLLILKHPWQHIFIDFHKLLTDWDRYNIVMILVNYFGKHLFSILCYKNIDAKEVA